MNKEHPKSEKPKFRTKNTIKRTIFLAKTQIKILRKILTKIIKNKNKKIPEKSGASVGWPSTGGGGCLLVAAARKMYEGVDC